MKKYILTLIIAVSFIAFTHAKATELFPAPKTSENSEATELIREIRIELVMLDEAIKLTDKTREYLETALKLAEMEIAVLESPETPFQKEPSATTKEKIAEATKRTEGIRKDLVELEKYKKDFEDMKAKILKAIDREVATAKRV